MVGWVIWERGVIAGGRLREVRFGAIMKFLPTRSRSGFHVAVLSAQKTCAKYRREKWSTEI